MYFHMSQSLNYAPVHNLQQTSSLSSLCNANLTKVAETESLMSPVAARVYRSPSRGTESLTNLCFNCWSLYIVTGTLFSLR